MESFCQYQCGANDLNSFWPTKLMLSRQKWDGIGKVQLAKFQGPEPLDPYYAYFCNLKGFICSLQLFQYYCCAVFSHDLRSLSGFFLKPLNRFLAILNGYFSACYTSTTSQFTGTWAATIWGGFLGSRQRTIGGSFT